MRVAFKEWKARATFDEREIVDNSFLGLVLFGAKRHDDPVVLNSLAGIAFGWLYWRRGLEAAMIAHFAADLVLHVLVGGWSAVALGFAWMAAGRLSRWL